MKMTARALACILAVAPVFACGDDEPTTTKDAGSFTVVDSAVAAADTGAKPPVTTGDGSVVAVADAGAKSDASTSPLDASAAGDSGRDSSVPKADSGGSTTDSGTVPPSSGTDGGQAGGSTKAFSAECLACEARTCSTNFYLNDFEKYFDLTKGCAMLSGVAAAGPSKGKARSQLCQDLVDCARRTGCAHPTEYGCLCGALDLKQCQDKAMADGIANLPGACIKEVRAAGEAADLMLQPLLDSYVVPANESNPTGLGTAIQLLQCGERVCTDACYAPCQGQPDQTVCDTFYDNDNFGKPERTCKAGSCAPLESYYADLGLKEPSAGDTGVVAADAGTR